MQIKVVRDGSVAIIELDGRIDTRGSHEFERLATEVLGEGATAVVVDLSKVVLITSAGIRVLFMMAQRLNRPGASLALCGLNDRVRNVLEVARLLSQFRVTVTRQEAVAAVAAVAQAPAATTAPRSKLTRLVCQTLTDEGPEPERDASSTPSALASRVLAVLQRDRV